MKIFHAAAAMAAIIVVQMILAFFISWQVAEAFSRTAVGALLLYAVIKSGSNVAKN